MSGILKYTTTIAATKTAGEMQTMLAKHGAAQVSVVYNQGEPNGIAFTIATQFGPRDFRLPANAEGVEEMILRQVKARQVPNRYLGAAQANRVAWRILKDWIAAQLAIIEAGMVTLDEAMLPYMLTPNGQTITQNYRLSASARAAIEAGPVGGEQA